MANSGTVQNFIAGNGLPKFETCGDPGEIERISKPTVTTWATILNLPILEAEMITPSVAAMDRKPVDRELSTDNDYDGPRGRELVLDQ